MKSDLFKTSVLLGIHTANFSVALLSFLLSLITLALTIKLGYFTIALYLSVLTIMLMFFVGHAMIGLNNALKQVQDLDKWEKMKREIRVLKKKLELLKKMSEGEEAEG